MTTTPMDSQIADPRWQRLYQVAGAAALLFALFIPLQIAIFVISPPPSAVADWFALLQTNRLVGLVDLDLLLTVEQVLMIPIYLALYVALRQVDESWMALGTVLGLIAVSAYIASNPAFAILSLSDRYAAATTEAQRSTLLLAGQATLATFQGTSWNVFYVVGSIAPIIISVVMLRDATFGRAIAYLGIVGNVVALGFYVPVVGLFLSLLSVVFLEFWYILLGRRLLQLGWESRFPVPVVTSA